MDLRVSYVQSLPSPLSPFTNHLQITYLSSSQGFDWNPGTPADFRLPPHTANHCRTEIFLPSYLDCDYVPLENRREPVHEIRLSDEELRQMLPE